MLWEKFDYNVWKKSFSKCVLLIFTLESTDQAAEWRKSILKVLMENEEKLKLDIEHHNNSYFYESDSLISDIFLTCLGLNLSLELVHSYIIHLLSHGAVIFKSDIDKIYYNSPVDPISFISTLLSMDLKASEDLEESVSPMYFKYTLQPNLYDYLSNCRLNLGDGIDIKFLKRLKYYYYFNAEIRGLVIDFDTTEDNKYKILEDSSEFPSLLELSRDASRKALCISYDIKNIGLFYAILNSIEFPNYIKELLTYQRYVYTISEL